MTKAVIGTGIYPHADHGKGGRKLRLLAALGFALLVALSLAGPALAAPGDLDPSFDGDGKVSTPDGQINDVAVQEDGKIVVAGNKDETLTLARYNPDGSLDTGFGSSGKVSNDFGNTVGPQGRRPAARRQDRRSRATRGDRSRQPPRPSGLPDSPLQRRRLPRHDLQRRRLGADRLLRQRRPHAQVPPGRENTPPAS